MIIKFLKDTTAPQEVYTTHCSCCGPEYDGQQDTFFYTGQEIDPDELYNKVDISSLIFNKDYIIITYP
jgi:hypothetical protein